MSDSFKIRHATHGEVIVGRAQWEERGHVTGWDEDSARAAGWAPVDEQEAEGGHEPGEGADLKEGETGEATNAGAPALTTKRKPGRPAKSKA